MLIHLHSFTFLLFSIHLSSCNPIFCNNTCGDFQPIPYPFHLQNCVPSSNTNELEEFVLECSNSTLFFPQQNSKLRYRVMDFATSGLYIDPLPDVDCGISNLKTFDLSPYKRITISALNYIQLFNCSGRVPPHTLNCSIPSPTKQLQKCFQFPSAGCLNSSSYHKTFSAVNCSSFTSWVLHNNHNRTKAQYGLKLDWGLRGECNTTACSANAGCSSGPLGYNCKCNDGYKGDGYTNGSSCISVLPTCDKTLNVNCVCEDGANDSCSPGTNNLEKVLIIAVGTLVAAAIIVALAFTWGLIKRKGSLLVEEKNMSNLQLETLVQMNKGTIKTEHFGYKELERATKCFSSNWKLGIGGFGTVYAARLSDGSLAAVKRIHLFSANGVEQVLNEVNVLTKLDHKNLVRLLGCCFERVDPLIVFEYVPNGTLSEHLQRERGEGLDWYTRISIATATAEALTYLHSLDPPIYHRDVKSANILLDYNFNAKVADFGLSRLAVLTEGSHISTIPQGTPGYVDPVYHQTYQLSDKCDVYSFGVVLVEILTGLRPVDFSRDKEEVNLAALAVAKIGNGCLDDIIDPFLQVDRNPDIRTTVQRVSELAFRCLSFDKDSRPTMAEVSQELSLMKDESTRVLELSLCTSETSNIISCIPTRSGPISLGDMKMVATKDMSSLASVQVPRESKRHL